MRGKAYFFPQQGWQNHLYAPYQSPSQPPQLPRRERLSTIAGRSSILTLPGILCNHSYHSVCGTFYADGAGIDKVRRLSLCFAKQSDRRFQWRYAYFFLISTDEQFAQDSSRV